MRFKRRKRSRCPFHGAPKWNVCQRPPPPYWNSGCYQPELFIHWWCRLCLLCNKDEEKKILLRSSFFKPDKGTRQRPGGGALKTGLLCSLGEPITFDLDLQCNKVLRTPFPEKLTFLLPECSSIIGQSPVRVISLEPSTPWIIGWFITHLSHLVEVFTKVWKHKTENQKYNKMHSALDRYENDTLAMKPRFN